METDRERREVVPTERDRKSIKDKTDKTRKIKRGKLLGRPKDMARFILD